MGFLDELRLKLFVKTDIDKQQTNKKLKI